MKPGAALIAGIEDQIKSLAAKRSLKNDTIGPVITWTTEAMLAHVDKLLQIPGARLAFGGKELEGHTIPKVYGAIQPTAVFVPLKEMLKDEDTFKTVTTEVFGPLQVCKQAPLPPWCTPQWCPQTRAHRYAFSSVFCFALCAMWHC